MFDKENYIIQFGDCRDLLKEIPDESINLVVTSPPYNIGKQYGVYKSICYRMKQTNAVEKTN